MWIDMGSSSQNLKKPQSPSVLYNFCKVLYIKKDTFAKRESPSPCSLAWWLRFKLG